MTVIPAKFKLAQDTSIIMERTHCFGDVSFCVSYGNPITNVTKCVQYLKVSINPRAQKNPSVLSWYGFRYCGGFAG